MNKVYNVSYDLNNPGQNYETLIEEIKKSPGYCKILKSTWLISTSEDARQLGERLLKKMDENDSLFVSKVDRDHYGWLPQSVWDWVKTNRSLVA